MPTHSLTLGQEARSTEDSPLLFAGTIGFYFVFRVALIFLFFQSNPVIGSIITVGCDLALLYGSILYSAGDRLSASTGLIWTAPLRWVIAFLAFALASLMWTGAGSIVAAFAYWTGMAGDVVIVVLLVRGSEVEHRTDGILKGVVWGAAALAVIAWYSPVTTDMRLGNDAFLHPNTLGLEIGIGTLIAQHLIPRGTQWKWLSIFLAVTLLRTLSKTAIIAFVVAECWYLLQDRRMTRRKKAGLVAAALLVVASFWSVVGSYLDAYNNIGTGDRVETLTGRTVLWATTFSMSLERLWFGHGMYSFRSLIPSFGDFQPVHAHNEFLQQFFEYGLAGVAITVGVYWSIYRQARHAPLGDRRTLALTLVIFALLHGLTDTTNFGLSYPIWLLAALSICLAQPVIDEVGRA